MRTWAETSKTQTAEAQKQRPKRCFHVDAKFRVEQQQRQRLENPIGVHSLEREIPAFLTLNPLPDYNMCPILDFFVRRYSSLSGFGENWMGTRSIILSP